MNPYNPHDKKKKKRGISHAARSAATTQATQPQVYEMPSMPQPGPLIGMKKGGKVKNCRGGGAATRGTKFSRNG